MKAKKTTSRRAFIRSLTKIMALSTLAVSSPGITKGQPLKGKIKLFNGKNLDGWYTYLKDRGRNNDPGKVFSVKNGILHITGKEWGYLMTNEEYENYKIVAEFKWGKITLPPRADNARDCGILIHSQGPDGAVSGTWMHSIECNIIEGGTGDFVVIGDSTDKFSVTCNVDPEKPVKAGSWPVYYYKADGKPVTITRGRINWWGRDPGWTDTKDFRGRNDIDKPFKWNRMEIIARGKEITISVNGRLVNHAIDNSPRRGRIQIQSESAEIFFRKIDLWKLE